MEANMKKSQAFKGKFHFLSNFYNYPFIYDGIMYQTSEAAFQAQKCKLDRDKLKYSNITDPKKAKAMGRREELPNDWDERCYGIMKSVIQAKFSDPILKQLLLDTNDRYLEEVNYWHDNRWGRCTCDKCKNKTGQNWLGKILMEVREELKTGVSNQF